MTIQFTYAAILLKIAVVSSGFASWVASSSFLAYWLPLMIILFILVLVKLRIFASSTLFSFILFTGFSFSGSFLLCRLQTYLGANDLVYRLTLLLLFICVGLLLQALTLRNIIDFRSPSLFMIVIVTLYLLHLEIHTSLPLDTIFILNVFGLIFGFFLMWQTETVISGIKSNWDQENSLLGSIEIYLSLFGIIVLLANQIRGLIVKNK
jgi:hypothetical protein